MPLVLDSHPIGNTAVQASMNLLVTASCIKSGPRVTYLLPQSFSDAAYTILLQAQMCNSEVRGHNTSAKGDANSWTKASPALSSGGEF